MMVVTSKVEVEVDKISNSSHANWQTLIQTTNPDILALNPVNI